MRRFTLFLSLLLATVMTTFAQSFEDGLYKIHWAWNGRGYMAFHADYPTEAKLADVTLNGYQNSHFSTTAGEPMSIYWYLITGADSKQYLFNADSGLFLNVSDVAADEAKANVLSETAETPIEIESNSTADYTLYGIANGVRYFLSSGCGQPSKTGHPVRWSTKTADLSDGGTPLQLIPVTDVTIDPTILAVAKEAVGLTAVEPEVPSVKWYRLKETSRNEYMNVASFDPSYEQNAYGMVNIAPYAESNDQIFTMEDAGDGKVYLRTNNNYYLTCGAWNVNVSPDAKEALIFEETTIDGATAYFIHASSQAAKGFKIGGVNMGEGVYSDDYYVYCDAPQNLWAYWVLEEATLVEETPVAPSYTATVDVNDAAMGSATVTLEGSVATFTATANEGYKFAGWLMDGYDTGNVTNPLVFDIAEMGVTSLALVAKFEALPPVEKEYLAFVSATPEDNSTVGSLSYVILAFDPDAYVYEQITSVDVKDANGNVVTTAKFDWMIPEVGACMQNELVLILVETITEAGTYTITLPENAVWDYSNGTEEMTLTFTVDPSLLQTGVNGVDVEGAKVIYDVTGRRIVEITRPGIYIVDGVKVLVK